MNVNATPSKTPWTLAHHAPALAATAHDAACRRRWGDAWAADPSTLEAAPPGVLGEVRSIMESVCEYACEVHRRFGARAIDAALVAPALGPDGHPVLLATGVDRLDDVAAVAVLAPPNIGQDMLDVPLLVRLLLAAEAMLEHGGDSLAAATSEPLAMRLAVVAAATARVLEAALEDAPAPAGVHRLGNATGGPCSLFAGVHVTMLVLMQTLCPTSTSAQAGTPPSLLLVAALQHQLAVATSAPPGTFATDSACRVLLRLKMFVASQLGLLDSLQVVCADPTARHLLAFRLGVAGLPVSVVLLTGLFATVETYIHMATEAQAADKLSVAEGHLAAAAQARLAFTEKFMNLVVTNGPTITAGPDTAAVRPAAAPASDAAVAATVAFDSSPPSLKDGLGTDHMHNLALLDGALILQMQEHQLNVLAGVADNTDIRAVVLPVIG
jgi:hypothetical protein